MDTFSPFFLFGKDVNYLHLHFHAPLIEKILDETNRITNAESGTVTVHLAHKPEADLHGVNLIKNFCVHT